MAPLLLELSSLEVEPLQIVEPAPGREGFDTIGSQESSLDTLTAQGEIEMTALLTGKGVLPVNTAGCCCCVLCCCCCPVCCCC